MPILETEVFERKPKQEIRIIAEMEAFKRYHFAQLYDSEIERYDLPSHGLCDKSDLFHFGLIFGKTLAELENGISQIPDDFKEHLDFVEKEGSLD